MDVNIEGFWVTTISHLAVGFMALSAVLLAACAAYGSLADRRR